jgi:hypothetical protein
MFNKLSALALVLAAFILTSVAAAGDPCDGWRTRIRQLYKYLDSLTDELADAKSYYSAEAVHIRNQIERARKDLSTAQDGLEKCERANP